MTGLGALKRELVNVVVVGDMNPAIHHPNWYAREGIISNESAAEALKSEYVFVQPVSQFRAAGIRVTCQPARWEVSAERWDLFPECLRLAEQTWTRLAHTPFRGCGLNVDADYGSSPDLARWLAHELTRTALILPANGIAAQVVYTTAWSGGTLSIAVKAPAERPEQVTVGVNVHFDVSDDLEVRLSQLDGAFVEARQAILRAADSLKNLGA